MNSNSNTITGANNDGRTSTMAIDVDGSAGGRNCPPKEKRNIQKL